MSFFYTKYFWISFILSLISLLVGLWVGRIGLKTSQPRTAPEKSTQKPAQTLINPLFTTQTAVIKGKVIKVNGQTLTIQNNQGLTGEVKLTDSIFITKYDAKGKATTSTDFRDLEKDKDVIINLQAFLTDPADPYRVIAITLLPPLPNSAFQTRN